MGNKICILLIIISLYSCSEQKENSIGIPNISTKNFEEKDFSLSYFADNIIYIPLDTTVYIKTISKIEVTDSLIFISSKPVGLLVYKTDGKFLRKIGKKGYGPREYIYGSYFSIDNRSKRIYVYDVNKIIIYSYNGKFIRQFKLKDKTEFINFIYLDNKLYFIAPTWIKNYKDNNIRIAVYDTLGNSIHSTKFSSLEGFGSRSVGGYVSISTAYKYNKNIQYWNQFNDTLFKINNLNYEPKYFFKNDKFRMKPKLATTINNFGMNKIYTIVNIIESKRYMFIIYMQYGKEWMCIFKRSDKSYVKTEIVRILGRDRSLVKFGVRNNIDGGVPLDVLGISYQKINQTEYLARTIDAIDLIYFVKSEKYIKSKVKYPEKKKALKKLADSLDENDNPILMLIKLKQ